MSRNENEYSLDSLLNHGFSLFIYHIYDLYGKPDLSVEEVSKLFKLSELSFTKVLTYSIYARKVLKETENPRDVVDFKQFINIVDENTGEYTTSLTNEELHEKYNAKCYEISHYPRGGCGFKISDLTNFKLVDIDSLSPIEKEAFYGIGAQNVMGWIPSQKLLDKAKVFQKKKDGIN